MNAPDQITVADTLLEVAIAQITVALHQTVEQRFVKAQRYLISLRTPAQVRHMEVMQDIGEHGHG